MTEQKTTGGKPFTNETLAEYLSVSVQTAKRGIFRGFKVGRRTLYSRRKH